MEFVGYISKEMLVGVEVVYHYNFNYVIKDDGHFNLAIKMPSCNRVDNYALFLWDEFANDTDEERNRTIQSKKEETIRFFQETTGIINYYIPTLLYHEVQTIVRLNNGTVERYVENNNTDVLQYENVIGISVERDYRRNVWFVKVKGVVTFTFDNETSAISVFQIIKKDLSNYVMFRWSRL